mmetsp:Transcript_1604/g.2829  ORF Transcript_1604/g.2829 Transcript_1604/m.2829 type:complete len:373 (+) Transcript_1604:384-1502(+)
MGACGSTIDEGDSKNAALDRELRRQQQTEQNKLKFLLLGAGESGKSTLFKQMKILFTEQHGFTQTELEKGIRVVYNNILANIKILVAACDAHTPAEDQELADEILQIDEDKDNIDTEMGEKLKAIWEDAGVQSTWMQRSNIQVQDSLSWYMAEIDRIAADDYKPSNQDLLRSRVRTSGIVEAEFVVNGVTIAMFDVGGQRNERKKWIHAFDNVTAVIFVAAINEYDQHLFEDNTMNRIDEAVILFDEICNSPFFRQTSMILFLNKKDLFREKLAEVPFRVDDGPEPRFTDYMGPAIDFGGPNSEIGSPGYEEVYEASKRYILQLFLNRNRDRTKEIYHHVTCATDTSNISVVFNASKDIILQRNLKGSGFAV